MAVEKTAEGAAAMAVIHTHTLSLTLYFSHTHTHTEMIFHLAAATHACNGLHIAPVVASEHITHSGGGQAVSLPLQPAELAAPQDARAC